MLTGFLDLSPWGHVAVALLLTHITIIGVTVFLHRHQAHRALDLNPLVSHFFRLWLWMTTGMKTREWVAVHRKHHAKCETAEDPHSPRVLGLNAVLWRGAWLYRKAAGNKELVEKYGKGTPDDWVERHVYTYGGLGILLMLTIDLLLLGLGGALIWGVQMVWIPFWAAGVVNGIGHYWGYRNYECPDAATNIFPLGILIGGEELHNNHHTFSSSAKLSSKWWEFDFGWFYIRLLQGLRLARVKKIAPTPRIGSIKPAVDTDTLRAVLANRFEVMSRYSKGVVLPVWRAELKKIPAESKRVLKRARKALVRDETLLSWRDKCRLGTVLGTSEELQVVYRFKQQLQAIWQRGSQAHESLLEALQGWCKQAEATGIQALEDFARGLRGYTLGSA